MPIMFSEPSDRLSALLDVSPSDAIQQARTINLDTPERLDLMSLKANVIIGRSHTLSDALRREFEVLLRDFNGVVDIST